MLSQQEAAGDVETALSSALTSHPEPFLLEGGERGVLLVHGFTGSPHSMRYLGDALHAAGYTVLCDLLPGHQGTAEAMMGVRWPSWYGQAEDGLRRLRERCSVVGVAGLSMGAALAVRLMRHYGSENIRAGALLAPALILDPALTFGIGVARFVGLNRVVPTVSSVGPDIADPKAKAAYPRVDRVAVSAAFELAELMGEARRDAPAVRQPALVMHSHQDHTVPFRSATWLSRSAGGPVRLVPLHDSYHVITVDYDRRRVAREVIDFMDDHLVAS